jgi:hypothetical protein
MINGSNGGWHNGFATHSYSTKGSFTHTGSFGTTGYVKHCQPQPKPMELWCLPIQNFRIDGGKTNLYSQRVTIDWPQFRPQSPIFSGPVVKQDTTDLIGTPSPNYNFDDCYNFGDCTPGVIRGLLPGFQQVSQNYVVPYQHVNYGFNGMTMKW